MIPKEAAILIVSEGIKSVPLKTASLFVHMISIKPHRLRYDK